MSAQVTSNEGLKPTSDIFTTEELQGFEKALKRKKEEVLQEARSTIGSGKIQLDANEMKDEVDQASQSIQHDLTFRLLDRLRKLMREIDNALNKIYTGDYGYCEGTGEVIPKKRLELTPWVKYSVEHKERLERLKKQRKRGQRGVESSMDHA